jgi:hypothetical protein
MGNEEIESTDPIPDICPWLQAGWVFRDGDARAIERQSNRARAHTAPVRDE